MSNKKLRVEFSVSWLAGTTGEYEFDDSQEFSEFMEMDEEEKRNFLIDPADKYTEGYMTWATAISGGAA